MRRSLFSLSALLFAACGSSPATQVATTAAAVGPLNDQTIEEACAEARHNWSCKVAASAEGYVAHACECTPFMHVSGVQAMNIEGVDEDDAHVDRDYALHWRGGRWHLGELIDRPSMYDED